MLNRVATKRLTMKPLKSKATLSFKKNSNDV